MTNKVQQVAMQHVMATVREVVEHLMRIVLSPAEQVFGGSGRRPFEQMPADNVAATSDMKRCGGALKKVLKMDFSRPSRGTKGSCATASCGN